MTIPRGRDRQGWCRPPPETVSGPALDPAGPPPLAARVEALLERLRDHESRLDGAADGLDHAGHWAAELERIEAALRDLERAAGATSVDGAPTLAAEPVDPEPAAPGPPPAPAPRAAEAPGVDDDERRRERRFGLKVFVGLESEHNFYTGLSRNISSGGLFIATHRPLDIGAEVELLFQLPAGGPMHTHGQVTWVRAAHPDRPGRAPGMGVRFIDLSPEQSQQIRAFVRDREPLLIHD